MRQGNATLPDPGCVSVFPAALPGPSCVLVCLAALPGQAARQWQNGARQNGARKREHGKLRQQTGRQLRIRQEKRARKMGHEKWDTKNGTRKAARQCDIAGSRPRVPFPCRLAWSRLRVPFPCRLAWSRLRVPFPCRLPWSRKMGHEKWDTKNGTRKAARQCDIARMVNRPGKRRAPDQ